MLSSVELPIANLELSDRFDYDFVIASTCQEYYSYKEWYMDSDRFMILDNGAFEKGEAVDDNEYLELALELKPDVLVIPDVLGDVHGTLQRYNNFMQLWKLHRIPDIKLMGVIQCSGNVDVAHIMGNMYYSNGVEWIGIPYYRSFMDRFSLIKEHPEWSNVHILGLPTLPEALSLQTLPNVKSCDSSLPVKCALQGERIEVVLYSSKYAKPDELHVDENLLSHNLDMFKAVCDGTVRLTRL